MNIPGTKQVMLEHIHFAVRKRLDHERIYAQSIQFETFSQDLGEEFVTMLVDFLGRRCWVENQERHVDVPRNWFHGCLAAMHLPHRTRRIDTLKQVSVTVVFPHLKLVAPENQRHVQAQVAVWLGEVMDGLNGSYGEADPGRTD